MLNNSCARAADRAKRAQMFVSVDSAVYLRMCWEAFCTSTARGEMWRWRRGQAAVELFTGLAG